MRVLKGEKPVRAERLEGVKAIGLGVRGPKGYKAETRIFLTSSAVRGT